MSDEKKPFTVTDRRHFNAEGEARSEDEQPAAPPVAEVASPPPGPRPAEADEEAGPGVPPLPPGLSGVLVFLGMQASFVLGEGTPPGEPPLVDLRAARAFIDMLDVLHEKTQGNRTPEEDRLLEDLLYQLRMEFVKRSKGGA